MRWLFILVLLPLTAQAASIQQFDPAGNRTGELSLEAGRWVQRDLAGNPHGYWQKDVNGCYEHHTNAGDPLGKVCQKPQ